ncbi:MAG: hypothetical protein ACD_37C00183G0003 [uncultured bacterium]|nr:MAG: hypothetical protein ACD_37C00183G0003 [uncultured bacterium]
MRKAIFIFSTASILFIFLIFFVLFKNNDGKLHLVICNVGQGDAIFIRTPNQADILIDGGPDKKVLECLSRHMPFWDRSLDAVILTHPHADHVTGLVDVIERYRVKAFYSERVEAETQIYKLFRLKLAEEKLSAKDLYSPTAFKEKSGLKLSTLWPTAEAIQRTDQNNANLDLNGLSVIQLLEYRKFKALLTGDAGVVAEDSIAQEAGDVDVLKVPHHGSKTGMSSYLLSIIKPELAVISLGAKNKYGHPSKLSLDLLKEYKAKILRTDLNGEIEIISDGKIWSIKTGQ